MKGPKPGEFRSPFRYGLPIPATAELIHDLYEELNREIPQILNSHRSTAALDFLFSRPVSLTTYSSRNPGSQKPQPIDKRSSAATFIAMRTPALSNVTHLYPDRWRSGRKNRTRNAAYSQRYRGFESHPLRHKYQCPYRRWGIRLSPHLPR